MRDRFFSLLDDAFFVLDSRGRLRFINPALATLLGVDPDVVRGLSCRVRRAPAADASAEDHLAHLLSAPPEVLAGRSFSVRRWFRPRVEPRWCQIDFLPLRRGEAWAIIGCVRLLAAESVPLRPLPERLLALRQQHVGHWTPSLLGPADSRLAYQARLAAEVRSPVLLTGPPGCGKATVARVIHQLSPERDRPFADVDCRRLPATVVQSLVLEQRGPQAPGYILLRGVDHLAAGVAERLAQWLQPECQGQLEAVERMQRPRLLASSGSRQGLGALEAPLGVLEIAVPSLLERLFELPSLVENLLARIRANPGPPLTALRPAVWDALRAHHWPGNLRELFTLLTDLRPQVRQGIVELTDLPPWLRLPATPPAAPPPLDLEATLAHAERRLIALALHRARGNRSRAAELLCLTRAKLQRRIDSLGLNLPEPPP
jgi:energy-coupling factor transporter ATP-binding protein EcfA2